jgi:N-acyl-D-aspartate/D-glutamate deacylase
MSGAHPQSSDLSLVIRNARIIDGTGSPAFTGDVGVDCERIVSVGKVPARGATEMDAAGKVLAPGFIDIHTHYDPQLCWDQLATPTPEHGVTSLIIGNCSVSLAPVAPEAKDTMIGWFSSVEDLDTELLRRNVSFTWETSAEYLDRLRQGLGPNVGAFVGHAAIRAYVMGGASQERAACEDEVAAMTGILSDALKAGSFGLSFTYNHLDHNGRELPCAYAGRAELAALLRETARQGKMVEVSPDFRAGADTLKYFDLFGELSLETGARVTLSPILVIGGEHGPWRERLARLEYWREKGATIYGQTQVRPLDMTVNLAQGAVLFGKTPLWRSFLDLPLEGKIATLDDDEHRAKLVDETDTFAASIAKLVVQRVVAAANRRYLGRSLKALTDASGARIGEVLVDILRADRLETTFTLTGVVHANPKHVIQLLDHPYMHVGSADAGAHITVFSGAGDTCCLFEKYVREEGPMTLERAVQRLTSDIARDWKLTGRGEISPGKYADLVIFDPETIGREPETWVNDLPGGGGRYVRKARGIDKVVVNGQVLVDNGQYTDARRGQLL